MWEVLDQRAWNQGWISKDAFLLGDTFAGHGIQHPGKDLREQDRFIARGHGISRPKQRIGIAALTPNWTLGLWDKSQVEASGTAPTGQGQGETNAIITAQEGTEVVSVVAPFNPLISALQKLDGAPRIVDYCKLNPTAAPLAAAGPAQVLAQRQYFERPPRGAVSPAGKCMGPKTQGETGWPR